MPFSPEEVRSHFDSVTTLGSDSLSPTNLLHLPPLQRVAVVWDIRGDNEGTHKRRLDCTACVHSNVCPGEECRRMN